MKGAPKGVRWKEDNSEKKESEGSGKVKEKEVNHSEEKASDVDTDLAENGSEGGEVKGVKKTRGGRRSGGCSTLTRKKREAFSRRLHDRIHFGKTQKVRSFLKRAYGDDLMFFDDEPGDACMWSRGRFKPRPTRAHRKASRVGERLHFDVFTSSVRSD